MPVERQRSSSALVRMYGRTVRQMVWVIVRITVASLGVT